MRSRPHCIFKTAQKLAKALSVHRPKDAPSVLLGHRGTFSHAIRAGDLPTGNTQEGGACQARNLLTPGGSRFMFLFLFCVCVCVFLRFVAAGDLMLVAQLHATITCFAGLHFKRPFLSLELVKATRFEADGWSAKG